MYCKIYRPWLIKLINERLYLSKKGYRPDLKQTALQLKNLIEYNGYRSDQTLAGLLIRKSEQIAQLIPKNKAYAAQILTLKMAIAEGENFISTEIKNG